MKLRLALAMALLTVAAHAEEADKQSRYRISQTEVLTVVSSSTRSSLLPNDAGGIRIAANTDIHFKVGGASVTATVSDTFIKAGVAEYFDINATDGNYVAFTRDTVDGKVWMDIVKP